MYIDILYRDIYRWREMERERKLDKTKSLAMVIVALRVPCGVLIFSGPGSGVLVFSGPG
jgi:hypothetical protein